MVVRDEVREHLQKFSLLFSFVLPSFFLVLHENGTNFVKGSP